MLSGITSGGAGGGGGGLQMASSATSALSDRSPINIAPIGFNLGAILQPMNQGSPENGGAGLDFMNRYSGQVVGRQAGDINGANWTLITIAGGAGLIGLFLFLRR